MTTRRLICLSTSPNIEVTNMSEQFMRSAALLGDSAMARLQSARVAVFGVGGVGGYVCEALVRSSVGALDVFDKDDVSITNLNRQIIALHSTVGQDKVSVLAARMRDINPDVVICEHKMFYLQENADEIDLTQYDFVVDAVDTVAAKIELAVRCEAANIPLIAAMGAGNKLDPSKLLISDVYKTSVCPLARAMRNTLRKKGVQHLTVAYSTEEPVPFPEDGPVIEAENGRHPPASMAFVPSAMGLLIASHVVRKLTGK